MSRVNFTTTGRICTLKAKIKIDNFKNLRATLNDCSVIYQLSIF